MSATRSLLVASGIGFIRFWSFPQELLKDPRRPLLPIFLCESTDEGGTVLRVRAAVLWATRLAAKCMPLFICTAVRWASRIPGLEKAPSVREEAVTE